MQDQYRLIKFYGTTCQPCKVMAPVYAKVAAEKNFTLEERNAQECDKAYLTAMNVRSIPTLCLMRNDLLVASIVGTKSEYEVVAWINEALNSHGTNLVSKTT